MTDATEYHKVQRTSTSASQCSRIPVTTTRCNPVHITSINDLICEFLDSLKRTGELLVHTTFIYSLMLSPSYISYINVPLP